MGNTTIALKVAIRTSFDAGEDAGVECADGGNEARLSRLVEQFVVEGILPGVVEGFGDVNKDDVDGFRARGEDEEIESERHDISTVTFATRALAVIEPAREVALQGVKGASKAPFDDLANTGATADGAEVGRIGL